MHSEDNSQSKTEITQLCEPIHYDTWSEELFVLEIVLTQYDSPLTGREHMSLLIPNTQHPRTNGHDLIFCVPITTEKWNKWKALSDHHKKQYQGVSYMDRVEGGKVQTLIFLPSYDQTDDDVLMALAGMRMLEQMTCRAYVVRMTYTEPSRAQIANAVLGADPDTIMEVRLSSAEHEDIDAHEKRNCGCPPKET